MSDDNTRKQTGGGNGQQAPTREMAIQKIYLQDASLEVPNAPEIFRGKWEPRINVDLDTRSKALEEAMYEVVLRLTVTANQGDKPAYLVEVSQAGVFAIRGVEEHELGPILGSYCPSTLFPFARQVVNELVSQGGFPQLLLAPVNFDALYAEQVRRREEEQSGEAGDTPATDQP